MPKLRAPSTLYADQLRNVQNAIDALENGQASFRIGAISYTSSNLPDLYSRAELLGVRAAIQAIEEGGQAYQIGDKTYTRADLRLLYNRVDLLTRRSARVAQGGARVRLFTPLG